MKILTVTIQPLSSFGTLLKGDTLFGQFCWTLRGKLGNVYLEKLLNGYCEGEPFVVFSDAFPSGYLPRPTIPLGYFRQKDDGIKEDRKVAKKRAWLPHVSLAKPISEWLDRSEGCEAIKVWEKASQPHNSIDRNTGTTGNGFAPYAMDQFWPSKDLLMDIHVVIDTQRIETTQVIEVIEQMGLNGFGRDATIGAGKFTIGMTKEVVFEVYGEPNAALTLAPVAPKGLDFEQSASFYTLFSRFGRHGGQVQSVYASNPFKTPILLADTGAIFTSPSINTATRFIGQGIGGNGKLSRAMPETVHQGYAPVIPVEFRVDQKKVG